MGAIPMLEQLGIDPEGTCQSATRHTTMIAMPANASEDRLARPKYLGNNVREGEPYA